MVSFFGLGKKKKPEAAPEKSAPPPTQWKKVDQNAFGEGQFFGSNVKNKPFVNGSIRDGPSRPGTSSSMRNSPYALQTHNFAASSMYDLSNMPGPSWSIEAGGTGHKSSGSDANLGMRWANTSSTSLQAPSLRAPRPGTPTRPGTAGGERKKPWVNPLDVHFNKATPAVSPAPKSPLGNFELKVDVDGTGSLMGGDKLTVFDGPSTSRGAATAGQPPPIITQINSASPPPTISPLLGPPSSPPTGSLPSPPRSVNGAATDRPDGGRSLRPHQLETQKKGFGPAALPSPALSQRGGSGDSSTGSIKASSSLADSDPWDGPGGLAELGKPVIQNVAAKRDTLTISGPRRQSLSMKIEELEKSLVSAQQESEQKSKAATAAGTVLPQTHSAPGPRSATANNTPQMRSDGFGDWQLSGRNNGTGPVIESDGQNVSGHVNRNAAPPPMHPDDRRPSPGFAGNLGPRSHSPMHRGPSPNVGPPQGGQPACDGPQGEPHPSYGPGPVRGPPPRDLFDNRNRGQLGGRPYDGRAPPPHSRNDLRPNPPFANRDPGPRAQSPSGRSLPAQRPESPMGRGPRNESPLRNRGHGAESPVDRPPPKPFAREPPPRNPMRNPGPPAGPADGGAQPVFPKRGNGPNSSNPNSRKAFNPNTSGAPGGSPPAAEPSLPQALPSPTLPSPTLPSPGLPSPLPNMMNGPGPTIRGPHAPRRPAPEEYGVIPGSRNLNRGPPKAAVGAVRANAPAPSLSRRVPSDDSDGMQGHQPLHPPPRPQQEKNQPQQQQGLLQDPSWASSSNGDMRRDKVVAPLPSPLFPSKENSFGAGKLAVSVPSTPDSANWPLPSPSFNLQAPPVRPRTAGGPDDSGSNGSGFGSTITQSSTAGRKPQRPHVPPPLNLFSAQQYAEEIGKAGPYSPSPPVPLTPQRSMTTPVAACDDPRPKTAGANGDAGTIGMARGLSLRYERERKGEVDPTWGGGTHPPYQHHNATVPRRPDFGLNAPTGIADRFGTGFI